MRIIDDLKTTTLVAERNLVMLFDTMVSLISQEILESDMRGDDYAEINLEFGTLYIKLIDDIPRYKFVPTEEFNNVVKKTYRTKKSRLVNKVDKTISDRIMNTYKDLF